MRSTLVIFALTSVSFGQALVEHAAAAAGGSVGGVAGKKVSDGLTAIFQKVDKQTAKAAKGTTASAAGVSSTPGTVSSSSPLFEVGPGVPKQKASVPPPPPPLHNVAVRRAPLPTRPVRLIAPQPEVEQPVQVSPADLKAVRSGMTRSDVLKLGTPSARVTMYDDGHLLEIYRYVSSETDMGTVWLTDGSVSSIRLH